jgi:hypothetical protein
MKGWLEEGFFVRLTTPERYTKEFFFVEQTEHARYKYTWAATIAKDTEDGPRNIEDLKPLATDRLYQCIFGIKTACYIYLNLPLNTRMWGTDKRPIASSSLREVGYRTADESPYEQPSFVTEFFLQKDGSFDYPGLYAYNPTERTLKPKINFLVNKTVIEKVTDAVVLEKLEKKLIPYRPITLGGIPPIRTGKSTS